MSTPPVASAGEELREVLEDPRAGFFRGEHASFLPVRAEMERPEALARHVLAGWMPPAPFITPDTNIVAFGSCFAAYISAYLNNLGFDVATGRDHMAHISVMGDGIVNVFAIRQQFEWAWEGKAPTVELWHGFKAEEFGYDEAVRVRTRELFDAADVFILTLGLSEIWYDEPTGEVFWRAVPKEKYDPGRHRFRVASIAETGENLLRIYNLIRQHRPEAAIVLTVSPIPLSATFRPVSCLTASSASKAILRATLDELCRDKQLSDPKLFYFPAYEIVTQCFRNGFAFDFRHPLFHVLDVTMKAFERYFCTTGMSDDTLATVFEEAIRLDRALGGEEATTLEHSISATAVRWLSENPTGVIENSAEVLRRIEAERQERVTQREQKKADMQRDREERQAAAQQRRQQRGR